MLELREMTKLLDGKKVSEQEYLQIYKEVDGIKYEYENGRLKSIGMSVKKVERNGIFLIKLFESYFDNPQTIAGIVLNQFILPTEGQQYNRNFRRPDIAVIINDDIADNDSKTDRIDIGIELISEGTKTTDHGDKKTEYQTKRISYYFILDKFRKDSRFYRLNSNNEYEAMPLKEDDIIELPYKGLKFRLSDLFSLKEIDALSKDPLYEYSFGYLRNKGKSEGKIEGIQIGKTEGIQIGKTEGIQIGKTEGIQIGKTEGEKAKTLEIARNLKSMGLGMEQIIEATGLDSKELDRL